MAFIVIEAPYALFVTATVGAVMYFVRTTVVKAYAPTPAAVIGATPY